MLQEEARSRRTVFVLNTTAARPRGTDSGNKIPKQPLAAVSTPVQPAQPSLFSRAVLMRSLCALQQECDISVLLDQFSGEISGRLPDVLEGVCTRAHSNMRSPASRLQLA